MEATQKNPSVVYTACLNACLPEVDAQESTQQCGNGQRKVRGLLNAPSSSQCERAAAYC